jgi:hypothetical protein
LKRLPYYRGIAVVVGGLVQADELTVEGLEALRVPLTGYCYRLLGSATDTDDAVRRP